MEYQTKTDLILPFKGEWVVGNGGADPSTNNHIFPDGNGPKEQAFAYDFKKEHQGDGKNLEDYAAFGEEVIAPGAGTVVQVISGALDNEIGERDRGVRTGNALIIDHHNEEWSVLCHFKYDSIKVKIGDKVIQGDTLGLCGNTGNTSEPHIHYHLQDNPRMSRAVGLPALFRKIKIDGEEQEGFMPLRGQRVSNLK